jgi:hypothetical protein
MTSQEHLRVMLEDTTEAQSTVKASISTLEQPLMMYESKTMSLVDPKLMGSTLMAMTLFHRTFKTPL